MSTQHVDGECAGERVSNEELVRQFADLLDKNPASRGVYRLIVEHAKGAIDREELASFADELPKPATFIQSSQNAITTLVRVGMLAQTVLVNGNVYAGEAEDVMDDESIPEDASISYVVQATQAGCLALEQLAPSREVAALLEAKPQHRMTFCQVMRWCAQAGGKSMRALEALLEGDREALKYDTHTNRPTVYPAYFTSALEGVGALAWDAKSATWKTTEAGLAAL